MHPRFVLHFVGDMHQPLHAADHEDRGGNTAMVLFANRTVGTALHGFWDTEVVKRLGHDPNVVASTLDQKFAGRCSGWIGRQPARLGAGVVRPGARQGVPSRTADYGQPRQSGP